MSLDRLLDLTVECCNRIFQHWRSAGKPCPFGPNIALGSLQSTNARKAVCNILMGGTNHIDRKMAVTLNDGPGGGRSVEGHQHTRGIDGQSRRGGDRGARALSTFLP